MKFKINKEHFVTGLRQVINVVGTNTQFPELKNVLIKAEDGVVTLTTTNLDLAIRCAIKAEVESSGDITLPAKKLAQIIMAAPNQEITVESTDGMQGAIRSGTVTYKINGLKAEGFPPLPSFVNQHSYEFNPQELLNMLRSVSYAQSSDENRYVLNSVYFNFAEDKLTLVATDGKRLALISRELKLTPEEEGSIILPKNTVTELEKLLAQGKDVKISFNNRQVAFDIAVGEESQNNGLTGSIYLVSKILEGNYPNYKQVIPREAEHRIKVDRELMLAAVQRISLVASDKQKLVRLKMADNQMVVSCQTVDVGEGIQPVEIEYNGPEVQIGFNPDFLQSPLSKLTKDEIYFEFKDENTPGVFKTLDNFLCVIMPMRI